MTWLLARKLSLDYDEVTNSGALSVEPTNAYLCRSVQRLYTTNPGKTKRIVFSNQMYANIDRF
jgi:hypothetical protein